ncbi:MAG TPA: MarR family transcriptional regulator [Ramlibacter sp.]|nr:MarR family transcriptional regulator [Ramlibacter sp.]
MSAHAKAHGSRPDATPAFYRPGDYKPQESIGFLMRRIVHEVSGEIERQFDSCGLTNAQWLPLYKLHLGSASTVAELARECQLDAGGMTRLLDRLEAKGLVRRVRSSEDRRVVNLELTEEGHEAARNVPAVLCRVQNAALRGFSTGEWQQLRDLLARMLRNSQDLHGKPEA